MGIYIRKSKIDKEANDWELDANSELVGDDSKDLDELEQEKNKYDMMHHKQRRVADWKSQELYGKDNNERYNDLKDDYLSKVNNTEDEYKDLAMYIEASISSNFDATNDTSEDTDQHDLQDDVSTEDPDYTDAKLKEATRWSQITMIKIIMPVRDLSELQKAWRDWQDQKRKFQRDSDNKSMELFGMTNQQHYEYIKNKLMNSNTASDEYDKTTVDVVKSNARKVKGITKVVMNRINQDEFDKDLDPFDTVELDTDNDKMVSSPLKEEYDYTYNNLPSQLPFFSYEEIADLTNIANTIDIANYSLKYEKLNESTSIQKWLQHYNLLCEGIITNDLREMIPSWIQKVSELTYELSKETDENKIENIRENLILLGWNPYVNFNEANKVKATKRTKKNISATYKKVDADIMDMLDDGDIIDNDVVNETAIDNKLFPVYVVLVFTNTNFGKVIKKYTNSTYTHTALALDSSLSRLYSFNGNVNGFSLESLQRYLSDNKDALLKVQCVFVKKPQLDIINAKVQEYLLNKGNTSYGYLNLLGIALNKPIQINTSMVCSQFVDFILKAVDIDITGKISGLVTPKDFESIKNKIVYNVFEGKASDYNPNKINKVMKALTNKAKAVKESYNIDIYDEAVITEVKEFPVQFDKEGNLLIKNMKRINFQYEYSQSHKLLKIYEDGNNIEGMKYELAKLWFLNLLLEKKLYMSNIKQSDKIEYSKIRARILNDFTKYLKIVVSEEKDFNFSEYYDGTPFSDATIKINSSTLQYGGKTLKDILNELLH